MSWIAFTSDDVRSEITPAEATQFAGVIDSVTSRALSEVRGAINAGGYRLDPDPTLLPPSLISDAIAIARFRLLTSIPGVVILDTDTRRDTYNNAIAKLKQIAAQKWPVEEPWDEDITQAASGNWNSESKIVMRTHASDANA